jgi:acetylornithine deacetylase/succinyl-diaminopimelate desuccinylase-like protein
VDPELIGSAAGTDMRNFVFDADIPAVNFGAGSFVACNCHAPDEFVPLDDLIMSAKIVLGTSWDVLNMKARIPEPS